MNPRGAHVRRTPSSKDPSIQSSRSYIEKRACISPSLSLSPSPSPSPSFPRFSKIGVDILCSSLRTINVSPAFSELSSREESAGIEAGREGSGMAGEGAAWIGGEESGGLEEERRGEERGWVGWGGVERGGVERVPECTGTEQSGADGIGWEAEGQGWGGDGRGGEATGGEARGGKVMGGEERGAEGESSEGGSWQSREQRSQGPRHSPSSDIFLAKRLQSLGTHHSALGTCQEDEQVRVESRTKESKVGPRRGEEGEEREGARRGRDNGK